MKFSLKAFAVIHMLNTVLKSSLNQCRLALQIAVYRLHNYANKCFAVW